MKTALILFTLILLTQTVAAQFSVKLEVSTVDPELRLTLNNYFTKELSVFDDVELTDNGKYQIKAVVIKRPVGGNTYDYFIYIISTADAFCVIGRDERGRITSSASCRELLTSNAYVGRENEVEGIVKEFIAMLNAFIFQPRRAISAAKPE